MSDIKIAKDAGTRAFSRPRTTLSTKVQTLKVLAAVDGSQCTSFVLKRVIEINETRGAIDVVLLNVQPQPQEWRLRGYQSFKRKEVEDRLIGDLGGRVVASAARQLDAVGIPNRYRIELGEPAEVIVRCACEEGCDLIVLAESSPCGVRRWLMKAMTLAVGSAASVVVHLAPMPVLVAK
jgi:nucleotide-binding universal stress UspA family protein